MDSSAPKDSPATKNVVNYESIDGVAVLEFNRPERRNALIAPMFDQLADHLDAVADDAAIGAVLLRGAGGAFCSGLDLDAYTADPPPHWIPTASTSLRRAHVALANCKLPIVVALERYAINGGAAFALAGDFLIAGDSAWLQVGEVRQGLPAPMNVAWLTARFAPSTVTRVVLAGDRIGAEELHRLTIAHEVVADDAVGARAMEFASQLAQNPPEISRTLKAAAFAMAGLDDAEAWFARTAELVPMGSGFSPERQQE